MTQLIAPDDLRQRVAHILKCAGSDDPEAHAVADNLVMANLSGHDSHGVGMVPRYVDAVLEGGLAPNTGVRVQLDTGALLTLDGQRGYGQIVGTQAMQLGMARARQHGSCTVALGRAHHLGRIGHFAEMAVAEGLLSIHFVNASGSVLVAPHGGVDRRFSTAPYCVGIPRPGQDPLLLDFATSIVAEGKVLVASQGGKKVPEGALIGPDGKPSNDPHLLYGDYTPTGPRNHAQGTGAIRAFGDHKGSGLAFMCEMLGGSFSGNGATDPARGRFANGMLSFYLDPKVFDPEGFFPKDIAKYVAFVKSSRPVAAGGEVLVPGEPESRMRAERAANGVPLPDDTWAAIVETARSVGLDERRIQQATM